MKSLSILFVAFLLFFGKPESGGAYTINYAFAIDVNGYTSPYSNVMIETFDNASPLWRWSGNGAIVTGSTPYYAAPNGISAPDTTKYLTVPENIQVTNTYTARLGGTYNYLGLWWGSVDDYNSLNFYKNGSLVASITGPQAISPKTANGNQTSSSTNLYVNILGLPDFDSFSLISTDYAFEADNIAVGVVPEPGTMQLLGLVLLGLAVFRRKLKLIYT